MLESVAGDSRIQAAFVWLGGSWRWSGRSEIPPFRPGAGSAASAGMAEDDVGMTRRWSRRRRGPHPSPLPEGEGIKGLATELGGEVVEVGGDDIEGWVGSEIDGEVWP